MNVVQLSWITVLPFQVAALIAPLLLFYSSSQAQNSTSHTPVETFAALPNFESPRLSPDGTKIAFFVNKDGRRQLVVKSFVNDADSFWVPAPTTANFRTMRWADSNMILIQSRLSIDRDYYATTATETRWFSFDIKKKKFVWLGKPSRREILGQHERIVDILPNNPNEILIELDTNRDTEAEVHVVNIKTGGRRIRKPEERGIQNWYTDHESDVRLGTGYNGYEWITKIKDKKGFWTKLNNVEWAAKYSVLGFTHNETEIYVRGPSQYGTTGVYKLHLETGKIVETIFEDEKYDVSFVLRSEQSSEIEGVAIEGDYLEYHFFGGPKLPVQKTIDRTLVNRINTIIDYVAAQNWFLIFSESDQNPGEYYIFDAGKKELRYLSSVRADIDPEKMATVEPVFIPVRDGSTIPGYITIPNTKEPKNLPTVVMPHGGPYGVRDNAEWDYEAQFYASRGYLVLKPNFRGSDGYGTIYRVAGHNQWGGLMQDDVTDATRWLISEGMSDPNRICIVGNSYGGYAALMGIIKEPALYKCAISVNGVTDLVSLKNTDRKYSVGGESWIGRMGLEGTADEKVSPYHRAEDINVPVLLMSSVDDARVPWELARKLHKKMKKIGKESTYVKIEDGTHNMVTTKARLTVLTHAREFLDKHIGERH